MNIKFEYVISLRLKITLVVIFVKLIFVSDIYINMSSRDGPRDILIKADILANWQEYIYIYMCIYIHSLIYVYI